jgi:glyoxylase-like metal-dependent hydrolase (beta-lactamase superfamily II)
MKKPVKRALLIVGLVVLLIVIVAGVGIAEMFVGLRPVEDGREVNGIRIVADGFTTMAVVPSGPGEVVLIDAGMDASAAALNAELRRRNLQPSAVKAVLLTHGHGDHIGAIAALPNAEVMALESEVPIAEGTSAPESPMGMLMPVSPTGVKVSRRLRDGETVTIGDATIRVYAVPGHTAGSAVYVVNGVLFLGDSAQITSDGEIRPAPWLVTDDRAQNRASLARLQQRLALDGVRIEAMVPAHSGPAYGDGPLVAFAREQS